MPQQWNSDDVNPGYVFGIVTADTIPAYSPSQVWQYLVLVYILLTASSSISWNASLWAFDTVWTKSVVSHDVSGEAAQTPNILIRKTDENVRIIHNHVEHCYETAHNKRWTLSLKVLLFNVYLYYSEQNTKQVS